MIPRYRALLGALSAALIALAALKACGPRLDARLAHLRSLQESGRYGDTLQPLREILSKSPDNPEANFLLGLGLMQTGRTPEAVDPLRKAAASDTYATDGGILLASALVAGQAYGEAVAATSRVIQKDPNLFTAWAVQAQAHLAAGDFAGALADSDKLTELQPGHIAGELIRVSALVRLDRLDEAEKTYASVLEKAKATGESTLAARVCVERAKLIQQQGGDDPRSEEVMLACVHEYPMDPGVLGAASDFYASRGRTAEGEKLWRDAAGRAPDSIPLRLGLAHDLARHGLVDEAEATLVGLTQAFPTSTEAWKALAELQRARGALDRALESLNKALAVSGGDETLRVARGDLLVLRGDLDGAEAALATLPDGANHDLLQGRLFFARRQYAKALDALGSALDLAPQNVGGRVLAGQAAEHVGDRERAIHEYQSALRLDPSIAEVRLALASQLLAVGSPGEAADLVWPVTGESSAQRTEALRLLAIARAQAGDNEGAREAATALRGLRGGEAAGWVVLAGLEQKSGGQAAAARLLERANLDYSNPANVGALRALIDALLETGRGEEAAAHASRAVAAHPDVPALLDLEGRVLARLGKLEAARSSFEKAQKIDPSYAPALVGLADLERLAGNPDQAIVLLDRASALDPLNGAIAYSAAQLTLAAGHRAETEQRLRTLIRRNPEVVGAANDLAYLLAERGAELDLALRLAEHAVASSPTADTLDTLGYVHLKLGESERAAQAFRRALAQKPDAAITSYHLGLALKSEGDREGARAAFQKALRQGPFPERGMVETELAQLGETPEEAHR
ncbi:MAG TPA: tetratricopeptide repeat protein [Myxococcota bacterium]|nr:tetratricopeptide repeat protein [Myxococcota bacterium]